MHPVFFAELGVPVPAYGLFMAMGYLAGLFYLRYLARARDLAADRLTDFAFLGLLVALAGARLLFVLTNLGYYEAHPESAGFLGGGGLVFYGGFLAAFPFALWYLRWRRLPLALSLDVLAPALALGHGIGRIGCFFAGCCHGRVCDLPWGMHFHSAQVAEGLRGLPLHPVQLYEAAGLLLLAGGLGYVVKKEIAPAGRVAALYAVGYGILRITVECFRGDGIRGFIPGTPVSTSQGISIALLLGGGAFLARGFRRNH